MPVTALVTLPDVLSHLNMEMQDDVDPVELQGFIDAATAYVQFQTGPIIPTTFTEVHSGNGPTIMLDNPPVLSITSVAEYVGTTTYSLAAYTLGTAGDMYGYTLDSPATGVLCRRYGGIAGNWGRGFRNVQVVYVAGRLTVPADIRMAALEDIRGLYTQTQFASGVGQFGAGGMDAVNQFGGANSRSNPVGAFPRLAALLAGPSRTPSIA